MNYYMLQSIVYIMSCLAAFYALHGVDFGKIVRKGQEQKINLLYILLSFAIGYGVAEFILVISRIKT